MNIINGALHHLKLLREFNDYGLQPFDQDGRRRRGNRLGRLPPTAQATAKGTGHLCHIRPRHPTLAVRFWATTVSPASMSTKPGTFVPVVLCASRKSAIAAWIEVAALMLKIRKNYLYAIAFLAATGSVWTGAWVTRERGGKAASGAPG